MLTDAHQNQQMMNMFMKKIKADEETVVVLFHCSLNIELQKLTKKLTKTYILYVASCFLFSTKCCIYKLKCLYLVYPFPMF